MTGLCMIENTCWGREWGLRILSPGVFSLGCADLTTPAGAEGVDYREMGGMADIYFEE